MKKIKKDKLPKKYIQLINDASSVINKYKALDVTNKHPKHNNKAAIFFDIIYFI